MAAISSLLAGKLSDIWGRRKMIIASSLLFIVGSGVCAIGIRFFVVLIGRIILGLAIGK
jgi:predicted MFS family arabinose efflux permease